MCAHCLRLLLVEYHRAVKLLAHQVLLDMFPLVLSSILEVFLFRVRIHLFGFLFCV